MGILARPDDHKKTLLSFLIMKVMQKYTQNSNDLSCKHNLLIYLVSHSLEMQKGTEKETRDRNLVQLITIFIQCCLGIFLHEIPGKHVHVTSPALKDRIVQ